MLHYIANKHGVCFRCIAKVRKGYTYATLCPTQSNVGDKVSSFSFSMPPKQLSSFANSTLPLKQLKRSKQPKLEEQINRTMSKHGKTKVTRGEHYLTIPQDTYPHPFTTMGKEEVLSLTYKELLYLNTFQFQSVEEREKVCNSLASFIGDELLANTKLASRLYTSVQNDDMKLEITSQLLDRFAKDSFSTSIIQFMAQSTHSDTRELFCKNVKAIVEEKSTVLSNTDAKSRYLMSYLYKLAQTQVINEKTIYIGNDLFSKILQLVPSSQYGDLYSYIVHINVRPQNSELIDKLRKILLKGTERSRFIARTGFLHPVWHDLNKTSFSELHSARVIEHFDMKEFLRNTFSFVNRKEHTLSIWSLKCMEAKFEKLCAAETSNRLMRQHLSYMLVTAFHVVTELKDVKSGLPILQYMTTNNIGVTFSRYHTILRKLRRSLLYDEFSTVLNGMDLKLLTREEKLIVAEEILRLIKRRYPTSPKVLLGYVGAMFGKCESRTTLDVLNEMGLLSWPYEKTHYSKISSTNVVELANVDEALGGLDLNCTTLGHLYEVIFRSLKEHTGYQLDASILMKYYLLFEKSLTNQPQINFSDRPITVFIDHLIRAQDPLSELYKISKLNYNCVKRVFEFYSNFSLNLKSEHIDCRNFEKLIETAIFQFSDLSFATKVIQYLSLKGKLSFKQIYPFVSYYFENGNMEETKKWFQILNDGGYSATSRHIKSLIHISQSLGTESVFGQHYKSLHFSKKRANRRLLETFELQSVPVSFAEEPDIE